MDKEYYQQWQMQSDLQRQSSESQMPYYAPQIAEQVQQNQAVLVEQTNPNRVLKEIEMALKNLDERPDGSIVPLGPPIVNDKGINNLKFLMRSVINQNTILSHLEDEEIAKLMIQLSNDITDDLTLNWRSYGIQDKALLDYIIDAIIYPTFFALKRAWGQNEKNWLGKISVESISNAPRIQSKKEGFWSKFRL